MRQFFHAAATCITRYGAALATGAALFLAAPSAHADQDPVGACLGFATDVSGSVYDQIDALQFETIRHRMVEEAKAKGWPQDSEHMFVIENEYLFLRLATAHALTSPRVMKRILALGGIGVFAVDFSDAGELRIAYRELRTEENIRRFADEFAHLKRTMSGGTNIAAGMRRSIQEMQEKCKVQIQIIDFAGDGKSSESTEPYQQMAVKFNIRFNGLAIVNYGLYGELNIEDTYNLTVKANGGFVKVARTFADVDKIMEEKIYNELQAGIDKDGVPQKHAMRPLIFNPAFIAKSVMAAFE